MGADITGLGELATAAKGIADKIWPDKTEVEKAKLAAELQEAMNEFNLVKGQLDINAIEAASPNMFVAGWRPMVGWIGATGFAYATIVEPTMKFILTVAGYKGTFPVLDTTILLEVLFALLGIAGLRTFEKYKGVTK